MKKLYRTVAISIVMLLSISINVFAEGNDYVIENNKHIPIPLSYEASKVINNLGEAGHMKQPEDLFTDSKGLLYVVDTGNNRVLRVGSDGKTAAVFKGPKEKSLNNPTGIYVSDTGDMYIADTGNARIVCLSSAGDYKKQYVKPDSKLLGSNFTFDPTKIAISPTGYIYMLKNSSFMSIDEQNNFRGYLGAKEVGFDLRRMLIRMFASRSQRDRTVKQTPDSYTNFVIGDDGAIYGTIGNAKSGQITKLNSVGKNTYPDNFYGETGADKAGMPILPNFIDIAVDNSGIISALEKNTGHVYQYDQEGNLLTAFGGIGDCKGSFQVPSSIAVDNDGNIYVSDSKGNSVQVFEPTNFIKVIHEAVTLYGDGKYDEAKKYWQQVLSIDANYSLAHKGIAKVYMKDEEWKKAMDEYKIAGDTDGYSKAFSEYRHETFRKHFFIVVFLIISIVTVIGLLFSKSKKKSDIVIREFIYGERSTKKDGIS